MVSYGCGNVGTRRSSACRRNGDLYASMARGLCAGKRRHSVLGTLAVLTHMYG